jgi:hypothetical protein
MQLPFCKICGECHGLGHCPLWDEPPEKPHAKQTPAADRKIEEESAAAVAQDQGGEVCDSPARPFTPEDMKQEEMPDLKTRFDRNAYQRELMRQRRSAR